GRVLHHPQQYDRYTNVEHGTNHEGSDDAEWQVPLGILRFLGRRGHRIKPNVSKEDDGPSGDDATESRGREGFPVAWMHQGSTHNQKNQDRTNLNRDHDVIRFG